MNYLLVLGLSLALCLPACSREYTLAVLEGIERGASAPITTCRTTSYASRGPRTTSYTTCSTY